MLAEIESLYDGKKGKINHSFKKCALYDASTSLGRIHPSCFTSIIILWTVAYWNVVDNSRQEYFNSRSIRFLYFSGGDNE